MTSTAQRVPYRRYVRLAAAAFLLITAYSVTSKLVQDRLGHDWLHSVRHVLSAAAAIYAGCLSRSSLPARAFTLAVGIGYTLLGVLGWFIPGFFLHNAAAVPLDPAANVFHLVLGVPALGLVVHHALRSRRHRRAGSAPLPVPRWHTRGLRASWGAYTPAATPPGPPGELQLAVSLSRAAASVRGDVRRTDSEPHSSADVRIGH